MASIAGGCAGDGAGAVVWIESHASEPVIVVLRGGIPGDDVEQVEVLVPAGQLLARVEQVEFVGDDPRSSEIGEIRTFDQACIPLESLSLQKGFFRLTIAEDRTAEPNEYSWPGGPPDVPELQSRSVSC